MRRIELPLQKLADSEYFAFLVLVSSALLPGIVVFLLITVLL
jgi:hypothetical protein